MLLRLEVEITLLEKELDMLDREDDANEDMWYRIASTADNEDLDPRQRHLLDKIRVKIKEYGV